MGLAIGGRGGAGRGGGGEWSGEGSRRSYPRETFLLSRGGVCTDAYISGSTSGGLKGGGGAGTDGGFDSNEFCCDLFSVSNFPMALAEGITAYSSPDVGREGGGVGVELRTTAERRLSDPARSCLL